MKIIRLIHTKGQTKYLIIILIINPHMNVMTHFYQDPVMPMLEMKEGFLPYGFHTLSQKAYIIVSNWILAQNQALTHT